MTRPEDASVDLIEGLTSLCVATFRTRMAPNRRREWDEDDRWPEYRFGVWEQLMGLWDAVSYFDCWLPDDDKEGRFRLMVAALLEEATPTPSQAQDGYEADAIGEVSQGNPNG